MNTHAEIHVIYMHAYTAVLAEFKSQLHSHTEQIKKYSEARVPSEALQEANASLIETVKRHTQGSLALLLC